MTRMGFFALVGSLRLSPPSSCGSSTSLSRSQLARQCIEFEALSSAPDAAAAIRHWRRAPWPIAIPQLRERHTLDVSHRVDVTGPGPALGEAMGQAQPHSPDADALPRRC